MPGSDKSYDDRYSRVWGFSDRTGGSESLGRWITFFDSLWKVKGVLFREGGGTGLRARRERYVLQCRGPQIFQWKTSLGVTGVSPGGQAVEEEEKKENWGRLLLLGLGSGVSLPTHDGGTLSRLIRSRIVRKGAFWELSPLDWKNALLTMWQGRRFIPLNNLASVDMWMNVSSLKREAWVHDHWHLGLLRAKEIFDH